MKPMLMGAMLGAGMGLVQGKDPLKSALIGGATAGIGDKLMGAESLFNVGSDQLTSELATQGLGGMQPIAETTMGAMNPETISMFTPDGTSMLGTQNSVFGLGDPMSNQYMDLATNTNLGAESVSNLNVPNTGLFKDTSGTNNNNIFQKGTDLITDQFDDDMSTADKAMLGMSGANLLTPQPEPQMNVPAPQVIQGKSTDPRDGLLAINVPKPFTSFASVEDERRKLFPTSYQG
ncbi:hypothetical protein N9J50_02015 [Methylophilaceae bacterium]|nr:hypothetical protein [Methylophilaceae bacterium]